MYEHTHLYEHSFAHIACCKTVSKLCQYFRELPYVRPFSLREFFMRNLQSLRKKEKFFLNRHYSRNWYFKRFR